MVGKCNKILFFLFIIIGLVGCRSSSLAPIETETIVRDSLILRDSSILKTQINRIDSVVFRDSVVIHVNDSGRVIRSEMFRIKESYKELSKDYEYILNYLKQMNNNDSKVIVKEVEKKLSSWQIFKIKFGEIVLIIVSIFLFSLLIKKGRR